MQKTRHTFCRICEPSCGLLADVQDNKLVRLRPDNEHPVSRGYACHKGLNAHAVLNDPDRLDVPMQRCSDKGTQATFKAASWEDAIAGAAAGIQAVREKYGHDAVAGFVGNPVAFNALGTQALTSFFMSLACRRIFTSATQDCANKFAGSEAVFGTSTLHPIPDLEHTRYALIFGENPKVSHMSFVSMPDPVARFRSAVKNGARIWFVNPRRIESATSATGEALLIRPDTDLYFMAALLHEMDRTGLWKQDVIDRHGKHASALRAFIKPWDADTTEQVTGIAPELTRQIASEFGSAESACVHMSTGINMGGQGTLCYWLLHMLCFVTGNLDRRGGNLYSQGFYPAAAAGRIDVTDPGRIWFPSDFGDMRVIRGALPGNLLPDMIESAKTPVRALVVISANPLLSMGGGERLRKAFETLEHLVVLDIYRTATGDYADWLLPCTDMLERADINICGLGMQHTPHVQYTDAVVTPRAQRREEWWILGNIERALGGRPPLQDEDSEKVFRRIDRMLGHAELCIEKLRAAPHHTEVLPPVEPGHFYEKYIQTGDQRVDCCPPLFADALQSAHDIYKELQQEPAETLKLINLRTIYMQNSWYHNIESLKRPGQQDNPLHMAPADAQRLGIRQGDRIRVFNTNGQIETTACIDERLRQGTVAMSHGWGNRHSSGLRVARKFPGVNVNALLPTGPGSYEKLSNQAHMTGIPVEVCLDAAPASGGF